MQTRQNAEKNVKCGDFLSDARGNAKLMINFFALSLLAKKVLHTSHVIKNYP